MIFDVIVIGGGPAGLTAAVYLARANKKVLVLEKLMPGGQIASVHSVENIPGFKSISGMDFATRLFEQATSLGAQIEFADVINTSLKGDVKKVETSAGVFECRKVIIATGASSRLLNVSGEKEFIGRGVSYCATCDGAFFAGKTVVVVGGGNTAIEDVLYLCDIAKKVVLIHRRDLFRADGKQVEKMLAKPNVEIEYFTETVRIEGSNCVNAIVVKNKKTGEEKTIQTSAVFVAIGRVPETEMFDNSIQIDENGFISTNENMETTQNGVYAVGDVRKKTLKQVVTACGDGAIAAQQCSINY